MEQQRCDMCNRWDEEELLQIYSFPHSYVLLNRDQRYPGYCLMITKKHVTELFHLTSDERSRMIEDFSLVAGCIAKEFGATKMNYELLGNMVAHIHWHLIPRKAGDEVWPRPVWSESLEPVLLQDQAYRERCRIIREAIEEAVRGI
jgi:diadenosine tetraphosphate (Ap4A) HIT family hydrolase